MTATRWKFWIDRGGTFTDIIAVSPDGTAHELKLLSHSTDYADAAIEGIRRALQITAHQTLDSTVIEQVRMGTTVATNALLERRGVATALVTTRGFGDALEIAYQTRPNIFALRIEKPPNLYTQVVEANERIDARGSVLIPLDEAHLLQRLQEIHGEGIDSVAIAFVHATVNPTHERRAGQLAREAGFVHVSVSSTIDPAIKFVSRGHTTVADAYLSPVLHASIDTLSRTLEIPGENKLLYMQSSGGLISADRFRGHNAVLSGPAGGVVGLVRTAGHSGLARLIGFDMGGTSTDVSVYDGEYQRSLESHVAGIFLRSPALKIHTVAAGGGSRLWFRDGRFQVGPESAGALPGPACYGHGGPATITDANVVLGRIRPEFFPHCFGTGNEALSPRASKAALQTAISADHAGHDDDLAAAAQGFFTVAVNKMAAAIRKITTQQGVDPSRFTLACFGGAGGQHACATADALNISSVFVHPQASTLSALGIGLAPMTAYRQDNLRTPLEALSGERQERRFAALEHEAIAELCTQGVVREFIQCRRRLHLRTRGSDQTIAVPETSRIALVAAFQEAHLRRFGYWDEDASIVVEMLTVTASGAEESMPRRFAERASVDSTVRYYDVWFSDRWQRTAFYQRVSLPLRKTLTGPCVVVDTHTTVVIDPGWEGQLNAEGALVLQRDSVHDRTPAYTTALNPVQLELFASLYMHIAEQMGNVLQRTAYSVNIKERLDFSCAIFTSAGELIANAPHMPVHLGSMGESVKAVLRGTGQILDGDTWILNTPYNGGTHLPDITAVTPVFLDAAGPLFFVASRGHHADVGGISPGSMPAISRTIFEEGVLFDNFLLVRDGKLRRAELLDALSGGTMPARNPAQNLADLKAQVAANALGVSELTRACREYGADVMSRYASYVLDNGERVIRSALGALENGTYTSTMDNGLVIQARITVDHEHRSACVDFAGTSAQSDDNYNAPSSVCRAAVMYVFRCLADRDIPINDGCLRPIEIRIPEGSLLAPQFPAAVAAGNVETSQCLTDTLFAALGKLAASQGTMNNLTFGNNRYQYYETICGGAGAGTDHNGASAVQTHMTNSALTDVEILESRYPVCLLEFALRRGSGGAGQYHGGDGVIRTFEFLEKMEGAILSGNRLHAPFGLDGGGAGATGETTLIRADGRREKLPYAAGFAVDSGDRLQIKTPGGGGFHKPASRSD